MIPEGNRSTWQQTATAVVDLTRERSLVRTQPRPLLPRRSLLRQPHGFEGFLPRPVRLHVDEHLVDESERPRGLPLEPSSRRGPRESKMPRE